MYSDEKSKVLLPPTTPPKLTPYLDKVFHCDARELLSRLPDASIDSVVSDLMYGTANYPSSRTRYDWGHDPFQGDPHNWWEFHAPIYREFLRVLKPGGKLAMGVGCKFAPHHQEWFGDIRQWSLTRMKKRGLNAFGNLWLVQTRERQHVPPPDRDSLVIMDTSPSLLKQHPCPKAVEEMEWLVEELCPIEGVVLDVFCGTGTTLVAAKRLDRHWIGCDISRNYCRLAKLRLNQVVISCAADENFSKIGLSASFADLA
jgi:DNA modification methylase